MQGANAGSSWWKGRSGEGKWKCIPEGTDFKSKAEAKETRTGANMRAKLIARTPDGASEGRDGGISLKGHFPFLSHIISTTHPFPLSSVPVSRSEEDSVICLFLATGPPPPIKCPGKI